MFLITVDKILHTLMHILSFAVKNVGLYLLLERKPLILKKKKYCY